MPPSPYALFQESPPGGPSRWWRFERPSKVLEVSELGAVVPAVEAVESAVAGGLHAVGYLAYEAAPGFDPALAASPPGTLPLAWWGLFERAEEVAPPARPAAVPSIDWRPLVERQSYDEAIARIHAAIAAGETYQVNYTFQLEAPFSDDPETLFAALYAAQRSRHAAYLDTGRFVIASASPELFFAVAGDEVTARPMKGTARRGRYAAEDRRAVEQLATSAKERAENVMVVDMVRNDLGRIPGASQIEVTELCRVETYPTLHQLTSTVRARSGASVAEILRALFPSASITGAPKRRTTQIIRALEDAPRGVYTGTVGYLAPPGPGRQRRASFNVAIRTVTVDRERATARYGTGGGVVWDSRTESEFEECRTKALVLSTIRPAFELLETLVWHPRDGWFLLERHLERMAASAAYFGFQWDGSAVRRQLTAAARSFGEVRQRVRLRLGEGGRSVIETRPWPLTGQRILSVCLDDRPVDSTDVFLYHKTTHRATYEAARRRHPGLDDVILWNERGELTESTLANLVVRIGGQDLTPSVDSGLLAGTYRSALLERGLLHEAVLEISCLREAESVYLINSVRGRISVRLTTAEDSPAPELDFKAPSSATMAPAIVHRLRKGMAR